MTTVADKVWTKEEIKLLLVARDAAILRGLKVIYSLQTESEKETQSAQILNGVGFSGVDAEILTSFWEFYEKRGFLSKKQWQILRKKILKYAGQLTRVANGEINVII